MAELRVSIKLATDTGLRFALDMGQLNWVHFPKSHLPSNEVFEVIRSFEQVFQSVDSSKHEHDSNAVLAAIEPGLTKAGFKVETSKKSEDKIAVPVLFGLNGAIDKTFNVDAHHASGRVVVEVEAGRAVVNNQFLKDFFEACMMQDVDHVVIAVRNDYRGKNDFTAVVAFFDALYASRRMVLPLKGVLILGY